MNHNAIDVVVRELPTDDFTQWAALSDEERAYALSLAERRRREWVAWRALLHEQRERWSLSESVLRVAYAESGEPIFEGLEGSISVTHSRRYVALARSGEGRCGVDVEQLDRNFESIENKYISEVEQSLSEAADPRFRAVAWCAKEAAYKCLGRSGIDFRRDLRIVKVDFEGARVQIEAFGHQLCGTIRWLDGAVLVAVKE